MAIGTSVGSPTTPFIAIVPARLGSSRLPEKPLKLILGVPMVVRVAHQAQKSGAQRVVIATDDDRIVQTARDHGIDSVLTRVSHATGTDRIAEAVDSLDLSADAIVVNVQGDEPLIPPAVIRCVAGALALHADCDMATAAHAIDDPNEYFDPNVVKVVIDHAQRALMFSRAPMPWSRDAFAALTPRQCPLVLPDGLPVLRHIGLYAYRVSFLRQFPSLSVPPMERHECLEQLRALFHGVRISVVTLSHRLPPGVDTPEDLDRVSKWLREGPEE